MLKLIYVLLVVLLREILASDVRNSCIGRRLVLASVRLAPRTRIRGSLSPIDISVVVVREKRVVFKAAI